MCGQERPLARLLLSEREDGGEARSPHHIVHDHHATRHCARVSPGCCGLSLYCILDLSIGTYWLSVSRWPYFSLRSKKRSEYSLLDTWGCNLGT